MMVLCLDFGNSQLKYACLAGDQLVDWGTIKEANFLSISSICQNKQIDSIILSSVIDVPTDLINALKDFAPFHQLSSTSLTQVNYKEYDKTTLGVDRLALAEGAQVLYPNSNHLSICMGTCITYNWVVDGHFKGGAISPGLMMRTKSMHDYTAHLPLISPQMDFPLLGHSTVSNLLAGTMSGIRLEVQGFIEEMRKQDPKLVVLICGGDAPFFIPKLRAFDVQFEAELIWKGLAALAKLN
ncbi:type III pantothenate kinase [Cytophagaceae bacterium 50C-KIRBA]|uniref:Type III pantothenate kinase n=1 Tax=Aquirufa beregesia TaxID=2516556 RepID=A0ABX0EY31_9BACT|nr:type III pantothenate kinase [Aquirufa beregesia]NGZ44517.1 type III pantothenate kinase [Aquirufa beregesia]